MNQTSKLLCLFDEPERAEKLFAISLDDVPLGMTRFQILHFVLNKKEFTNAWAQFKQAKFELFHRMQIFADLYYQLRKTEAEIKLAKAEKRQLQKKEKDRDIREAKLELKQIEIDKSEFAIVNIKRQAGDRLNEALAFYEVYNNYNQELEGKSKEELEKMEVESWKIKSAYYPELPERYNLMPEGFLRWPHEDGGLKALMQQPHAFLPRRDGD